MPMPTDMNGLLDDLLLDMEKVTAVSPKPSPRMKESDKLQGRAIPLSGPTSGLLTVNTGTTGSNLLSVPKADPSFLYSPDRDILTGLPLTGMTPSPAPVSPRLAAPAWPPPSRPTSALAILYPEEMPPNDNLDDKRFQSYHLDYKFTPPPVKGPCCVCGDGIMGAMVTALDKMWHPEHFCCFNCGIELKCAYEENSGKPYCKICYGKLFLPPCAGCGRNTEGNYVKAMGKIWHPECLKCIRCHKILTPTTVFEKDGQGPYCEDDYWDLFGSKCYACKKAIKDGRKISVIGRNYHTTCFRCCECGVQLSPNNYKERAGKLYCIKDYNDKFFPKCCKCHTPVLENEVNAMGKTWHPKCFNCTECRKVLSPDKYWEKNGLPYCEDDYHRLFSAKCHECSKPIKDDRKFNVNGKNYHIPCFKCCECGTQLSPNTFKERNGKLYCEKDFANLFPKCAGCHTPVMENGVVAMGKTWHPNKCFNCTECRKVLSPDNYWEKNGLPYCEDDYHKLFSPKCAGCSLPIKDKSQLIHAMGKPWHKDHFNCVECGKILTPENYFEKNGLPYCEDDYHRLFSKKCGGCRQPIKDDKYVFAMGQYWHPDHFTCEVCGKQLNENTYYERDGKVYCLDDFLELFAPRCIKCRKPIKEEYCLYALEGDWHADCFRCKDCNCLLEDRNFYEIDGDPYCEEHFHARQCPDCIKMRRAQNKYWGLNPNLPMGPTRWASQVSLKSLTEENNTLMVPERPESQLSQYSTSSYDTAYTTDGGARSSPSMRSYIIPIEREGSRNTYRSSAMSNGHVHGEGCSHNHEHERYQTATPRSTLKRGHSQSQMDMTNGLGKWSSSVNNVQYVARNENPYNYLEPGKFPVESKHIRFADTVSQREYKADTRYH